MVIVDTGSADATKQVAARFEARVFDFPWVDSFAAARNESVRHATGDWIFWLDADDRLDEHGRARLQALFAGLRDENAAYVMKCRCLPDPEHGAVTEVDHVRLFRNHPEVRWSYRVHEQVLPALRRLKADVRWSDVVIHHTGYQDAAVRARKLERDLRLLTLENEERPDDPFTLFNLGSVYHEKDQSALALPLLRRSLELSHPDDSIVRKLYALIAQCHRLLGQYREALAACQAGRNHYPDDTELLFQESLVRRALGDPTGSESCLVRLLSSHERDHFASLDVGLRGYKARHNLAVLYHEQGRLPEAEAQWRAALAEQPDYVPAWLGVGEVCLEQGRWDELEAVAAELERRPDGAAEAAVLRARLNLARREFAAARRLLEGVIRQKPESLRPRVVFSHVLLQEGRDWEAAEQTLREILALDPQHAEARQNLAVLLRQQGRV
jgi:tetratricopeptide (TPR) repeat protein